MTDDRANIKVPREVYERHKERKPAGQTWGEYLDGEAPETGVDTDELAREVSRQVDYAELADKTAAKIVRELR